MKKSKYRIYGEVPVVIAAAGIVAEDPVEGIRAFYEHARPAQLLNRVLEEPGNYPALDTPTVVSCRQAGDFGNFMVEEDTQGKPVPSQWFHLAGDTIFAGRQPGGAVTDVSAPGSEDGRVRTLLLTAEQVIDDGVVPRFCPYCGHDGTLVAAASVFVGEGAYADNQYEYQSVVPGVRCMNCEQGFVAWRPEPEGDTPILPGVSKPQAPAVIEGLRELCDGSAHVSLRAPVCVVDMGVVAESNVQRWRADLGEILVIGKNGDQEQLIARLGRWKDFADPNVPYFDGEDYRMIVPVMLKAAKLDAVTQTDKGVRPKFAESVDLPLAELEQAAA